MDSAILATMINQSIEVLTKPGIATFERFEKAGNQYKALMYVIVAAIVAGIFAFISAIRISIVAAFLMMIFSIVGTVVTYYVFSYIIFAFGKNQGGTGTQDEVFYSTSLYTAPILAVSSIVGSITGLIPLIGCILLPVSLALGLYQLYLGYLATRASMNLQQQPAIITVVVALVASWVVSLIIGSIATAIAIAPFVASGVMQNLR